MTELEKQYLEALEKAEEIGAQLVAHSSTSSRENSISYTKVQEARMWNEKHTSERTYAQMRREAHNQDQISL